MILLDNVNSDATSPIYNFEDKAVTLNISADDYGGGTIAVELDGEWNDVLLSATVAPDSQILFDELSGQHQIRTRLEGSSGASNVLIETVEV